MPGSTPTAVPSSTPMNANKRFVGCTATTMPCAREAIASTVSPSEQAFERPGGQAERQELVEHKISHEAESEADGEVGQERAPAESGRGRGEQNRDRRDEAAADTDERNQRHEP